MNENEAPETLEQLKDIAALTTELRKLAERGGDEFLVYLLSLVIHEASTQATALERRRA